MRIFSFSFSLSFCVLSVIKLPLGAINAICRPERRGGRQKRVSNQREELEEEWENIARERERERERERTLGKRRITLKKNADSDSRSVCSLSPSLSPSLLLPSVSAASLSVAISPFFSWLRVRRTSLLPSSSMYWSVIFPSFGGAEKIHTQNAVTTGELNTHTQTTHTKTNHKTTQRRKIGWV